MYQLEGFALLAALVTALFVGISKTGIPGVGILLAPLMAFALPAKLSVGALLPLLIFGDLIALILYRRHALWLEVWRLCPSVAAGMALGGVMLIYINDAAMKPLLGALVLCLLSVELFKQRRAEKSANSGRLFTAIVGAMAGTATTVSNAAGPIMSIYLVGMKLSKEAVLGTAAWFFFIVNLVKVAIFVPQGMLGLSTFAIPGYLWLFPAVVIGAMLGRLLEHSLDQKLFNRVVLALAGLAGVWLLVSQ